jgi:hypothetical protein
LQARYPSLFTQALKQDQNSTEFNEIILNEVSNSTDILVVNDFKELSNGWGRFIEADGAEKFGQFTLKPFESKEDMDAYISAKDHGYVVPGLCFGFAIHEKSNSSYELEMMLNDLQPE